MSPKILLAERSVELSAPADNRGAQRSAIPFVEEGSAFFDKLGAGPPWEVPL